MNQNQKGSGWAVVIIIIALLALIGSCSGGESSYERDARSGFDKWTSGDYDSMSDGERKAVNDFLEWSNDN